MVPQFSPGRAPKLKRGNDMALTNAERKLITLGNKELRERLAFNRDIEREIRLSHMRRAKIGDHYRLKM
jgi:mRNA-degrading endonuclease RelE of RelBE toxin-antitoxin system